MRFDVSADLINTTFFQFNKEEQIASLNAKLDTLRTEIRSVLQELNVAAHKSNTVVSARTLESLSARYPGLDICNSLSGLGVKVYLNNTSVLFHTAYKDSQENEPVYYVTMPIYTFSMGIDLRGKLSLRNETILPLILHESPLIFDQDLEQLYGHPHVSRDGLSDRGVFSRICYGNNDFHRILEEDTITGNKIIEVIRRWCIWVTHANLSDMYDTQIIPKIAINIDNFPVDDFFEKVQRAILGEDIRITDFDPHKYNLEIISRGSPGYNTARDLGFAYALWLYKHWQDFKEVCDYIGWKKSLLSAITADIASAYDVALWKGCSYELHTNREVENLMLAAPVRLKEQLGNTRLGRQILLC